MHAWSYPATYTAGNKYDVEIKFCPLWACLGLGNNLASDEGMAKEVARRAAEHTTEPDGVGPTVFYAEGQSLTCIGRIPIGWDFLGYETKTKASCEKDCVEVKHVRRNCLGEYVG